MIIILIIEFLFNQQVFGLPLRILLYSTIILYYIAQKREIYFHKIIWYSLVFYFLFLLIRIINGDLNVVNFYKEMVSSSFGLLAFSFICSNEDLNLKRFASIYTTLFILNSAIIAAQFFGMEWSRLIPEYFSYDYRYMGDGRYSYANKIDGMSLPTGLMDFTVATGYFHLSFLPTLFSLKRRQILLIFWFLTALFLGQRSVIFIALLFLVVKNRRLLFLFIPILFFWSLIELFLDGIGLLSYKFRGGSAIVEDADRLELVSMALKHVQEFPLLGGLKNYSDLYGVDTNIAHNLFLNALIYGGVIGLIILLIYLFLVGMMSRNYMSSFLVQTGGLLFLNSMLHNAGIVTGDFILIIFIVSGVWSHSVKFRY